jgi:uncharacterized small protein (DUF1192 family)
MFQDMILQQNQADALKVYQAQQAEQTRIFTDTLQKQIATSQEETARLKAQGAELNAAQVAAKASEIQGSYATETTSVAPTAGQTTAKAAPKAKAKTGLKIAPGSMPVSAGTGLNIGV